MKKVFLSLLLFLCLAAEGWPAMNGKSETVVPGKVRDGYALLTEMTQIFSEISRTGKGLESAEKRLRAAIADTAATFRAGKIDPVFTHRYRRLLLIFRLIMTKVTVYNNVWEPVIKRELSDFVRDVLGEDWTLKFGDKSNIGRMAAAMEEEFSSLWIYLDTLEQRRELKRKFGHRLLPPPPPPPKNPPPPPPKQKKSVSPPLPGHTPPPPAQTSNPPPPPEKTERPSPRSR